MFIFNFNAIFAKMKILQNNALQSKSRFNNVSTQKEQSKSAGTNEN